MKLDLHVHTNRSSDAHTRHDQLGPSIIRAGLDGLAVTDHNNLATDLGRGPFLIPGMEISSSNGHIIGLGVTQPIARGLSSDETILQIREKGGVSIVVHPYDILRSAVNPDRLTVMPDAVEVINSASFFHSISWKRAKAFAEKHHLPQTAGSDSHIPQTIGRSFTTIECEEKSIDSVLEAIRKGYTTAYGRPINFRDRIRKLSARN